MLSSVNNVVTALSVCGVLVIGSPVSAQTADQNTSAETATQSQAGGADEQQAGPASQKLGHGTEAQAEHSAEATAHKSVKDPNNQQGTSLQGRTRPIGEGDEASHDIADKGVSDNAGAQAADAQ